MHSSKRRRSALLGMPSLAMVLGMTVLVLCVTNRDQRVCADPAPRPTVEPLSGARSAPGIAYDEIARTVKADATVPPVGAFAADAAAIAALPPLVFPKSIGPLEDTGAIRALGLIPYVGKWLSLAAGYAQVHAEVAESNKEKDEFAAGIAARQRTGVLASFAFYRGWTRVALSPQYTTIDKPDQGQTITLDNSKRTYQTVTSAPAAETYTVQSGAQTVARPTILRAPVVSVLPSTRIAGLEARGYRTTGAITVARGTFACGPGAHEVTETEYVSDMPDPQYDVRADPSGTEPLLTACGLGASLSHREPGHLVLYRVITVDDGTPAKFSVALERGNVRTVGEESKDLFLPPPDFKETK